MTMIKNFSFLMLGFLATGCSSHYLVTTKLQVNQKVADDTEIVQSPKAATVSDKIHKVAIIFPNTCANQTVAAASGKSHKGTLMAMTCGVEMSALERSFARAGYEVVSSERTQEADALIKINSLERTIGKIPSGYKIDTRYDKTDSRGKVLGTANVPKEHAQGLKDQFVTPVSRYIENQKLLGVTLDATVIYVPANQAIWFYKKTIFEPIPKQMTEQGYSQLFTCGNPCEQINPESQNSNDKFWQKNLGVSGTQTQIKGDEDEESVRYSRLVGEVFKDFTDRVTRVVRD